MHYPFRPAHGATPDRYALTGCGRGGSEESDKYRRARIKDTVKYCPIYKDPKPSEAEHEKTISMLSKVSTEKG